ncbi:MAG: DUF512 domain-containing protein, partial [Anaerolineales bacterium]|nr:DUF512 domain-containing protein [Anaerolineales bacterium]
GHLFAPTLSQTTAEFTTLTGVELTVRPIHNERFGGTITAAGLLMASDIINQLQDHLTTADLIVLPRIVFDHPDRISLDDLTPAQVATQLGRPVALADTMGDVWDALLGVSAALHFPTP